MSDRSLWSVIIVCIASVWIVLATFHHRTIEKYINNGYEKTTIAGHDWPVWVKK